MSPWCAAVVCLLSSPAALAGPRPYAWVQGTDSLPEWGAELENWIGASVEDGAPVAWDWWVGPVIGVSDRVEAELFLVFEQPAAEGSPLTWSETWMQLSWLVAERGTLPVDARIQLAGTLPTGPDGADAWLTGVVSRDVGRLDLTANVAPWIRVDDGAIVPYLTWRAGGAYEIATGARVGLEGSWSSKWAGGEVTHRRSAGPALAYGRGRFWVSAGYQLGPVGQAQRGRLILGLVL